MAITVALLSLTIAIASTFWAVISARRSSHAVFLSTRTRKWLRKFESTATSDVRLAKIEAEHAALLSTLQKNTSTLARLSSRQGMQALRERQATDTADADDPPPVGASKAQLRDFYLTKGKRGAPKNQLSLVSSDSPKE